MLHVHDPLAWWPGHRQVVALNEILALAELNPDAAMRLAARGRGPHHSDPRVALRQLAIPIHETALWRWPFAAQVDYLVCATLTKTIPHHDATVRTP